MIDNRLRNPYVGLEDKACLASNFLSICFESCHLLWDRSKIESTFRSKKATNLYHPPCWVVHFPPFFDSRTYILRLHFPFRLRNQRDSSKTSFILEWNICISSTFNPLFLDERKRKRKNPEMRNHPHLLQARVMLASNWEKRLKSILHTPIAFCAPLLQQAVSTTCHLLT